MGRTNLGSALSDRISAFNVMSLAPRTVSIQGAVEFVIVLPPNAYAMTLDDDDYIHPEIAQLAEVYFQRFSDSWILRPKMDMLTPIDCPY